jgi:dipeptidyl aminopeptidase/acylaminoacyl peptidase
LWDTQTGEAELLFRARPWLDPNELAPMEPISFQAADGLTIHGYLTLPVGIEAKNLPTVLYVHGGPWSRDVWGFNGMVQFLANRGYAVLQVNYRGSSGYGRKFIEAAVGEWAGKMHADLIDGVKWAIGRGIADPKRIAIYGGSYGGYATLVGMTFTPEWFACGASVCGPSSLVTLIESFPPYWAPFGTKRFIRHCGGDPSDPVGRKELLARSPLERIDSIRAPLLIAQGANDVRVTRVESDQIVAAARSKGLDVEYIVKENEGHGFMNADNRLDVYGTLERFLAKHLGGRSGS